jgi:MYXO-CTERM domain-containing protein
MRAAGLAFACAIGVAFGGARAARACSCLPPPPPGDAASRAVAVFEGRTFGARREQNEQRFAFEVTRVWKGEVAPAVEVVTALHSAACGRSFELGVPYVVYASARDDGTLTDNLCSRSRMVADAVEDLDTLGAGRPPLQDGASVPGPAGPDIEPPRIEPTTSSQPAPTSPGKRGCTVGATGADPAYGLALVVIVLALRRRVGLWQSRRV